MAKKATNKIEKTTFHKGVVKRRFKPPKQKHRKKMGPKDRP